MLNTSLVSFDNFHHFALSCKLMLRSIVCHFPTLSADLLLSGCLSSCYIPSSSTSVRSIHFECLFEGLWNHRSRGPQTRIAFLFSQASLTTPCSPPFGFSFRLQSSPRFSMTLILISLHTWENKINMSGLISRKSVREWDRAVLINLTWWLWPDSRTSGMVVGELPWEWGTEPEDQRYESGSDSIETDFSHWSLWSLVL